MRDSHTAPSMVTEKPRLYARREFNAPEDSRGRARGRDCRRSPIGHQVRSKLAHKALAVKPIAVRTVAPIGLSNAETPVVLNEDSVGCLGDSSDMASHHARYIPIVGQF